MPSLVPTRDVPAASADDPRCKAIAAVIAEVRPGIVADGGDIELVAVYGQRIEVRLSGRCPTCGMIGMTLGAIRRRLIAVLDEVVFVVPYSD